MGHRRVSASSQPRQNRPCVKALDFFCGAGGLTRGLRDAGIEVLAGIDNDERLKETYEANNRSEFVCEDITKVDIRALRKRVGIKSGDKVLYAACTPCQPFSLLNQRRTGGVREDERRSLLLAFGELVKECPPDYVLVENVPGLGNAYGKEIYDRFLGMLKEGGFLHDPATDRLDAKDYGVPQVRKRFILLAARRGPIALPRPRKGLPRTVSSAIAHLPTPLSAGAPPNHEFRTPRPHHLAILKAIPHDGGSRSDVQDKSVFLPCHQRNPDLHRDVFGRMAWDSPAPTLTCRCTDVYCGRFAHPREDRGLTLREAAALQTFRDDYEFHGSFFHIAAQIGNAVPVRFARSLGAAVVRHASTASRAR